MKVYQLLICNVCSPACALTQHAQLLPHHMEDRDPVQLLSYNSSVSMHQTPQWDIFIFITEYEILTKHVYGKLCLYD